MLWDGRGLPAARGVEPAGALAQLAGQGVPRVLAGAQGNGEPVERARIEMAETDLHARAMQKPDHLHKCGTLKDRWHRVCLKQLTHSL